MEYSYHHFMDAATIVVYYTGDSNANVIIGAALLTLPKKHNALVNKKHITILVRGDQYSRAMGRDLAKERIIKFLENSQQTSMKLVRQVANSDAKEFIKYLREKEKFASKKQLQTLIKKMVQTNSNH